MALDILAHGLEFAYTHQPLAGVVPLFKSFPGMAMISMHFDRLESSSQIQNELELRAHSLLGQHPHFRGRANRFQYESNGRRLVVRGAVPTFYLKQLVQSVLMQLDDGLQVDNQIAVTDYVPVRGAYPYVTI
jgi:hypothetical protein